MNPGKTKSGGGILLEGEGVFKDYNGSPDGNPVFETKDPFEWEEHCKTSGITTSGTGPCAICSVSVEFEGLGYGKKPVCPDCRGGL